MKKIRYFLFGNVRNKQRFLRYKAQQTEIFVILSPFLLIYSTSKPKNQNFEKMKKKTPGDIIILHLSTTNDNHIMYGSWDMEFNRQNLFSYWTTFCPFTEKSKFWKKKPGDIISLHLCLTNDNHMMYGSLDIRCNRQNFLWTIFCPFNLSKNLENKYF